MAQLQESPDSVFADGHFGVISPLLMDETIESILVRGLEPIIVQQAGLFIEADQTIENDYQLRLIIDAVNRFTALADNGEFLSTYVLPGGVICQLRRKSYNNPYPILLFERPFPPTLVLQPGQLVSYVGDDAARFLSAAIDAGVSLIVCGEREKAGILGGLTHSLKANSTVVNIECGVGISVAAERTFCLNYIAASSWAKTIGPDRIIALSLNYRPNCILLGEIGDINLSAIFAQYSGQVLAGIDASPQEEALHKLELLIPTWFQQSSLEESLTRYADRIPLMINTGRLEDGSPVIQSISEIRASKESISSRTIYRRDEAGNHSQLVRVSSESKVARELALGADPVDEWIDSWGTNRSSKHQPSLTSSGRLIRWVKSIIQ